MLVALAYVVVFFNLMTSCYVDLVVLCVVPLIFQFAFHFLPISWVVFLNSVDLLDELKVEFGVELVRTVDSVSLYGECIAHRDPQHIASIVERAHSDAGQVKLNHFAFLSYTRAMAFKTDLEVSRIAEFRLCTIWGEVDSNLLQVDRDAGIKLLHYLIDVLQCATEFLQVFLLFLFGSCGLLLEGLRFDRCPFLRVVVGSDFLDLLGSCKLCDSAMLPNVCHVDGL